ncbi:MAG: DNA-binding protein [Acidovorax sp.]|uniref:DNA-binding protein n=1 Tax=Acidovorax sp. TaxID=1872122 RepID=UPI0039E28242
MSLSNLQAIGRLQAQPPDPAGIAKLLQAARQNLADARVEQISANNRFDAAYKCIMQCAMLGLWANGWRTSTSQPGHHQTAIQTLDQTMGVHKADLIVLDALRRQRNLNDYEGDPISTATLQACVAAAEKLLGHAENWLRARHPDWRIV